MPPEEPPCEDECCDCCDDAESTEPIRYANGEISLRESDLGAGGFGRGWGHQRLYSNQMSADFDFGNGHNWLVSQWAYLVESQESPGTLVFVRGNNLAVWFDPAGGEYVARHGAEFTLTHDAANGLYVVATPAGEEWRMHDFEQTDFPAGLLKSLTLRGGQKIEVTSYTADERIEEVQRSTSDGGGTTTESFKYDYFTAGEQAGRLQYATLRRDAGGSGWQEIRRAEYEYYGASEVYGTLGDLKRVKRQKPDGSSWKDLGHSFYRYYKQGDANGSAHGLKFVVRDESYARLVAAVGDPLAASDQQVAQFADYYFEFDGQHRVTKEKVAAGSREYSFAYTTSSHADGYNNWKTKTVETLPDGSQTIVYTNYLGQPLVKERKNGGDRWVQYRKYNNDAHPILRAEPSAVVDYDDSQANLAVALKTNDGLIHVTDYYTASGGGAAKGEVQFRKIKRGSQGAEIKRRAFEYMERTAGGVSVHRVSKETVYRNEDGTGAIDTTYSYTWHTGTVQMQERVTTLPAVPTAQNGSGTSNSRTERFDEFGKLIWTKDERGFITRHKYDAATGALVQTIQDVDTAQVADEPSGWVTPSGGGLHIITDYEHDDQGRIVQELGPEHEVEIGGTATTVRTATWTVYKDVDHETWTAQGYVDQASSLDHLVNPVSITKTDQAGRVTDEIAAVRASTSGKLLSTDSFPQSSWVRWSSKSYDAEGRLEFSRVYHTIPSSGEGSPGTNYDQTDYGYDVMSRQNKVRSPGGTITRTVFSVGPTLRGGQPAATYIGTNDASATQSDPTGASHPDNNMVLVTESEYDNGNAGGDGLLTKQTEHVDASTKRETVFIQDWRHRQTDIDGEEDFYQISVFDNLDRVTRVDRHDTTSSGNLIARSETNYDNLGRIYQTKRYAVNVTTGTVGNSLTDNTWYDETGNVIKEKPAGSEAFTKHQYDSLGRQVKQFIGFNVDETSYADAFTVVGDTIFEQSETDYDEASNVIETRLRRRHHDATGTGELTTRTGADPKARVSYVGHYSDAVGRQIAVANYGTNDDTALSRSSTIPTRSDDILVTTTEYNDDGEANKTIDPADKEDRTLFDDAGRVIATIENYTDGDPTTGGNDEDITVEFTYTADGQQATIIAKQKSASDDQTTQYVYGTSLSDSDISRTDLLRAVIYPDSDDSGTGVPPVFSNGPDGIYDRVEHRYNRQGEVKETKDQNETIHSFDFDKLGRQVHDRVIALGTNIDGAVRRISTTYNVRGQLEKITCHDNATVGSGSLVNEVLRQYNDTGLLDKEFQEHDGATDASTLYVGYNYDESASGGEFTKGMRATSIRYPDGRLVHFTYGSSGGDADNLNRLDAIKDDNSGSPGDTLASYSYLGLGTMVIEDLEEPEVKLDYFGGTSGTYAGFDRFDRIVDQRWYDYGASEDRDRFKYSYDRARNRTWKENTVSKNLGTPVYLDEFYTYDGVNRLTNMDRGQLNGTNTGIAGTPSREEDWTLDPLGNWSNYIQKTAGITDLDQERTINAANEITGISETVGTAWPTPSHDCAGNMSSIPQTRDLASEYELKWDAWNGLVKVEDDATTVAEYTYDGQTRCLLKDVPGSPDPHQHYYYNSSWQVLETRESPTVSVPSTAQHQYVWSARYIDAPILRDEIAADPGERIYYLGDANFNITTLLDTNGAALERYVYTPYGVLIIYNVDWSATRATSAYWNVYAFTGRSIDNETGVYNFRERWYGGSLGRFISRDPLGFVDGGSLYRAYYVPGSVDPVGLACKVCAHRISYRDTIVELDAFTATGLAYKRLADLAIRGRGIPQVGVTIPALTRTGLWTVDNVKRGNVDAGALRAAGYLFFVSFAICEDKRGDCRLFLDERGSRTVRRNKRGDVIGTKKGKDYGDITDDPEVSNRRLKAPWKGCERVLIYMDNPDGFAILRDGLPRPRQGFLATIQQRIEVRDRAGAVQATVQHQVVVGVSHEGEITSSP